MHMHTTPEGYRIITGLFAPHVLSIKLRLESDDRGSKLLPILWASKFKDDNMRMEKARKLKEPVNLSRAW